MKIASHFESKLGLNSTPVKKTAETKLPKSLRKLAKAEQALQAKVAKHQEKFSKVASGPVVKYAGGVLPAAYHVCERCQGLGKLAVNQSHPGVKFASTEEYLNHLRTEKCSDCKGKRVIKAVDDLQCSEQQLLAYAAEKAEKDEAKKDKKSAKAAKKIEKLERKAAEKKLALEDPEKYAAVKAEKKDSKSKKKAAKKLKKVEKKLSKVRSKYLGDSSKPEKTEKE